MRIPIKLTQQRRISSRPPPRPPTRGFAPISCSAATRSSSSYKAAKSATSRAQASHLNPWTSPESPLPRYKPFSTEPHRCIGVLGMYADDQQFRAETSPHRLTPTPHLSSPILLNQFIPFLVLCSNIAASREHGVNEVDLALITWISDNLGKESEGQVRTSPIRRIMRELAGACQQIAGDR